MKILAPIPSAKSFVKNKIIFKKNKLFFRDGNDDLLFLSKMQKIDFFHDDTNQLQKLNSEFEIFNIPLKLSMSRNDYDKKKLIVISGDYGAWGDKAYCNDRLKNTIFIAEGLNNSTKDTIINIVDTDNGFYLESIKLSD